MKSPKLNRSNLMRFNMISNLDGSLDLKSRDLYLWRLAMIYMIWSYKIKQNLWYMWDIGQLRLFNFIKNFIKMVHFDQYRQEISFLPVSLMQSSVFIEIFQKILQWIWIYITTKSPTNTRLLPFDIWLNVLRRQPRCSLLLRIIIQINSESRCQYSRTLQLLQFQVNL